MSKLTGSASARASPVRAAASTPSSESADSGDAASAASPVARAECSRQRSLRVRSHALVSTGAIASRT